MTNVRFFFALYLARVKQKSGSWHFGSLISDLVFERARARILFFSKGWYPDLDLTFLRYPTMIKDRIRFLFSGGSDPDKDNLNPDPKLHNAASLNRIVQFLSPFL